MLLDRAVESTRYPYTSVYDRQRISAAAGMMPELWQAVPTWQNVGAGRRIVVIGGGISGLCAAYSLRAAGFNPIVLECNERTGGRFLTDRGTFGDQYAEFGVTRIADSHTLTLDYIRHFNLPIAEYAFEGARQIYYVMGKRFGSTSWGKADYPADLALHPEEREIDAESLRRKLTAHAFPQLGDPRDPRWPSVQLCQAFADETFFASLARTGASEAAKQICLSYDGSEIRMFDAVAWLGNQLFDAKWTRTYAIPGGNDRLTEAFAAALGSDIIVTGAKVDQVLSHDDKVTVSYLRRGERHTVEGDYAVCTVPHPILREIYFQPQISQPKWDAAATIPMFKCTRLNFQFSRRFWNLDYGVKGLLVACTDTPIERLWDLTALQPGEAGILTAYVQDNNAAALDALPSDEARIQYGLDVIERFFPEARKYFVKGLDFSWHKLPWTKGGWPAFKPGQTAMIAALGRAEGRVRFAGDHTCVYTGWAQGALESAHFAVAEVIAACR